MNAVKIFKSSYKILALIGVGIILYFLDKSTSKFETELLKSGKFAIGTFKGYSYSLGSRGSDEHFEYFYYDSKGKYHNGGSTFGGKYPDRKQRKTLFRDDKFLILYNTDGSLILFDYPIRDTTDFNRYIKEFEQIRKK
jgi:hypothetical protein